MSKNRKRQYYKLAGFGAYRFAPSGAIQQPRRYGRLRTAQREKLLELLRSRIAIAEKAFGIDPSYPEK